MNLLRRPHIKGLLEPGFSRRASRLAGSGWGRCNVLVQLFWADYRYIVLGLLLVRPAGMNNNVKRWPCFEAEWCTIGRIKDGA